MDTPEVVEITLDALNRALDAAGEEMDKLRIENEDLHKKLIILRNAKCPKCNYRFKIIT